MASQSAPAVIDYRTKMGTVAAHVLKEDMVAPESLAQPGHVFYSKMLLPVEPPKIHSSLFMHGNDVLEQGFIEVIVLNLPRDGFAIRRVIAQVRLHGLIVILVSAHTIGRMEIKRRLHTMVVHEFEKVLGTRDEVAIPAPSRPTAFVPVHIHNQYVQGNIVRFGIAYDTLEFRLGIGPITAVPVTENIFGRQRHTATHLCVVGKTSLVIMAVTQEIPVGGRLVHRLVPPQETFFIGCEGKSGAAVAPGCLGTFINDGPTSTRKQSFFQAVPAGVAPCLVQSAMRAQQVQGVVLAGIPHAGLAVHLKSDAKVVRCLVCFPGNGSFLVTQSKMLCPDIQVNSVFLYRIFRHRQTAVHYGKGGAVLKLGSVAVLDAYHPACKHRKTDLSAYHHGCRICQGIPFVLFHSLYRDRQQAKEQSQNFCCKTGHSHHYICVFGRLLYCLCHKDKSFF